MTKVRYNTDGGTLHLRLRGHADYAESGADIVCSACSTVTYMLLQALRDNGIEPDIEEVNPGNVKVTADISEIERETRAILRGYDLLAANYPQNIKII